MPLDINKILKPGAMLRVKIIDYSLPEHQKTLKETRKAQEKILACKKVDWERMANFYITI